MKKILILLLLVLIATSQRGGGRSRSSSSRRSGRTRFPSWNFWGSKSNNTGNGTSDTENEKYEQGNSYIMYIVVPLFLWIGYKTYLHEKQQKKIREQKFQNTMTNFEGQGQAKMCTLSPQGMISLKDWFMSKKWKMEFGTNDKTFQDKAVVTLKNIKSRATFSYDINFSMIDSIGGSQAKGAILHQEDYFSIIFRKIYDNSQKSGQKGTFQMLVYKGVQRGQMFIGQWYYEGHENSSKYTGTWSMTYDQ